MEFIYRWKSSMKIFNEKLTIEWNFLIKIQTSVNEGWHLQHLNKILKITLKGSSHIVLDSKYCLLILYIVNSFELFILLFIEITNTFSLWHYQKSSLECWDEDEDDKDENDEDDRRR